MLSLRELPLTKCDEYEYQYEYELPTYSRYEKQPEQKHQHTSTTFKFGKYKGKEIATVPLSYLKWYLTLEYNYEHAAFRQSVIAHLQWVKETSKNYR